MRNSPESLGEVVDGGVCEWGGGGACEILSVVGSSLYRMFQKHVVPSEFQALPFFAKEMTKLEKVFFFIDT